MGGRLCVLILFVHTFFVFGDDMMAACNSEIYCNDEVLSVIQLSGIFNDSKTFVDMPMLAPPSEVLSAFQNLPASPTNTELLSFIFQYFDVPGSDLTTWTPSDWSDSPPSLSSITDSVLSNWAYALNDIWKQLGRQTKSVVQENPDQHSILPMNNGFIVPGGRFREFYYWDTYWIVDGLLACDMFDTVNGTLQNFVSMLDTFDFIPNGARVYYSERSQPPMFTQMVWSFYQASLTSPERKETAQEILEMYVPYLDKEYQFWMSQRAVNITVNGEKFVLNRYQAHSNMPRPEGYVEDIQTASEAGIQDTDSPQQIYRDLASGAETGWDFSSRWFGDYENLTTVHTSEIIPVDLNSILYKNEITLYQMHSILSSTAASNYLNAAQQRKNGIEKILWNESAGIWVDYNVTSALQRSVDVEYFYASSFTPLWANLYWDGLTTGIYSAEEIENAFLQAIDRIGMLSYVGGLPTSMINTGQQWDFPNGWAPLQMFAISGLPNLGTTGAQMAAELASNWLQNNLNGWDAAQQMFEKYDVTSTSGVPGEGGEYTVQSGFGWTNGAIFDLLLTYCTNSSCIDNQGNIQVPVLAQGKENLMHSPQISSVDPYTIILLSCLLLSSLLIFALLFFCFYMALPKQNLRSSIN